MKEIERKQQTLSTAVQFLFPISTHPRNVENGYLGYFLSKESIKECAHNLDVISFFESKDENFNNLPKKYQNKIKEVIKDIEKSVASYSLEEACTKAAQLEDEINSKILKLGKKRKAKLN